jgi:hypothetical protein
LEGTPLAADEDRYLIHTVPLPPRLISPIS